MPRTGRRAAAALCLSQVCGFVRGPLHPLLARAGQEGNAAVDFRATRLPSSAGGIRLAIQMLGVRAVRPGAVLCVWACAVAVGRRSVCCCVSAAGRAGKRRSVVWRPLRDPSYMPSARAVECAPLFRVERAGTALSPPGCPRVGIAGYSEAVPPLCLTSSRGAGAGVPVLCFRCRAVLCCAVHVSLR